MTKIDPTSSLLNRNSNTSSLEFIRRALKTYLVFLKKAESTRIHTVLEPINFPDEYEYIERLIHDINFVLEQRMY